MWISGAISRKKILFILCALFTSLYLVVVLNGSSERDTIDESFLKAEDILKRSSSIYGDEPEDDALEGIYCKIPQLDPWTESVKPFVKRPEPFKCPSPPPMSYLDLCSPISGNSVSQSNEAVRTGNPSLSNGTLSSPCQSPPDWPPYLPPPPLLTLDTRHVTWTEDISCCASGLIRGQPLSRTDNGADNRFSIGECKPFFQAIPLPSEFTVVNCMMNNISTYADIHSYAMPTKATLEKMSRASGNPLPPSILLLGIDSSSRLNFLRSMSKTRRVLEKAGAVDMNSYNKVGDNTFPNIIAILAGISEEDAMGRPHNGSRRPNGYNCWPSSKEVLDDCPYLFKNFSQSGYVTLLTEDEPNLGMFNYGKKGFRYQPTDHYTRPYYSFAMLNLNITRRHTEWCYSNKATHIRIMEYVRSFIDTYQTRTPYFALVYFTGMAHDMPPDIELVDDDMADFLKYVIDSSDSALERGGGGLFLAMFSDHGARFGKLRESPFGWMEERLPFLFIRPPMNYVMTHGNSTREYSPSLVKSLYPTLVKNRKRLTSPFDFYRTLVGLLPNKYTSSALGSSCEKCFDLLHQEVPLGRTCSDAAIPDKWCACGEVKDAPINSVNVTKASKVAIDYMNSMFVNNSACSNLTIETMNMARYRTIRTHDAKDELKFLELTFTATPGEGKFQMNTLVSSDGKVQVQSDPSRLNKYGNQSSCVNDLRLKLYCFCS